MHRVVCLTLFFFVSILSQAQSINSEVFLKNLANHCGKSYKGQIISNPIPKDFKDKELIMTVMLCEEGLIKVPFFVGDDLSRTWVFTLKDDGLELKHDHRKANGMPDEVTMYGGTATNHGLVDTQFFPADQYTANLIASIAGNVWWVTLSDTEFSYNLKRVDSEGAFKVVFDLTTPIESNKIPW